MGQPHLACPFVGHNLPALNLAATESILFPLLLHGQFSLHPQADAYLLPGGQGYNHKIDKNHLEGELQSFIRSPPKKPKTQFHILKLVLHYDYAV